MPTHLRDNILRRFRVTTILLASATNERSNVRKSVFYRSAMMSACSIVEALTYELARKNTDGPDHVIGTATNHVELSRVRGSRLELPHDVYICKKEKRDNKLDDADFGKIIMFLKNSGLIEGKYKLINWVRTERNKIHVQGLKGKDVGYTKAKVNRVGDAIMYLLEQIE